MGWLFVCFDLPVETTEERRIASRFRKDLIKDGYIMIQFSVYARPCPTPDRKETHLRRLRFLVPDSGEVRCLYITDTQWKRMEIFRGKVRPPPERLPEQLLLF